MCLWSSLVPAQATGALLRADLRSAGFSLQGTLSSVSGDFSVLGRHREAAASSLPGVEREEGASHPRAKEITPLPKGALVLSLGRGF